ncbi:MAG: hypothetical protein CEE38_04035 [Planctomycetes bacterium B3_Pla]|nr:MAG: hypothetical protein CEE38_04035 [Planctomycetes bacterium B3_Pla]
MYTHSVRTSQGKQLLLLLRGWAMESVRRKVKGRYFRKAVIYFLTFCLTWNTWLPAVMALESGNITSSSGIIGDPTWGDHTIIDTDHGAIIDWSNFNTSDGQIVEFNQYLDGDLSSMSAVLNRITSGSATQFDGALTANGRIFIVNPAGVLFGPTATVDVTLLIASTLNIDNADFLAGNYLFAGDGIGEVANYGTINAAEGAALIGKRVLNAGTIVAGPGGAVVMAAGDRVLLGEPGSKIIVEMDSVPEGIEGIGDVINDGQITAPGGTVVLAAGDIFSAALDVRVESGVGTVVQNGVINADGIDGDGGSVTLTAGDNVILATDSLTTANGGISNAGANGGEVIAYASELFVNTATVDFQTGARIEVKGGSPPPPDPIPIDIEEGATFDGGLAEISGDHLFFDGVVDATATPYVVPDPANPGEFITITPDGGTLHIDPVTLTLADGPIPDEGAAMDTFYEEVLEGYSQTGVDTLLEGDFDIIVEHITDGEITGGSGDIALRTAYNTGGITFLPDAPGEPVSTSIATSGGDILMLAGAGGITTGDLSTSENGGNPGRIRLFTNNLGNIETGALTVDGGNEVEVSIIASGDLVINGDVLTSTNKVPANFDKTGTANVCLVSENGSVDIDGAVEVQAHGKEATAASIHICAETTVTVDTGNGRIEVLANTSGNTPADTADAELKIHAGELGGISIVRSAGGDPVRGSAKTGGSSIGPIDLSGVAGDNYEETDEDSHLLIEIADAWLAECPDCPAPPVIPPPIEPDPIALPDFDETHMGDPVTGNVLTNDDESFTVASNTDPSHGTVEIDEAEGNYTYTPDEGYVGDDTFTYTATDGEFTSEPITVTITMTNTPPALGDDVLAIAYDATVVIDVLVNDSDPDNDLFTIVGFTYEGAGELVLNEDGTFTYTPKAGFAGVDSFTYSVTDGEIGAEPVQTTVTITVAPQPVPLSFPVAPGLERVELGTSGCPALVKWAAAELGADQETIQIWFANSLASGRNIQPCDACTGLKAAATVLQDDDGTHLAALAAVISEFASSDAPPSEEQMASIADAIANDVEGNMQYAAAGEYLDALAAYVGVLTGEMGLSATEAVQLATDNYVGQLADDADAGVAAYVATRLAELGG